MLYMNIGMIARRHQYVLARAMIRFFDNSSGMNGGFNYVEDVTDIQKYKDTFEMIFDVLGQKQHFDMMMNRDA